MERKVNEEFLVGKKLIKVIQHSTCIGCIHYNDGNGCSNSIDENGSCTPWDRKDKKSIIFKEIKNDFYKWFDSLSEEEQKEYIDEDEADAINSLIDN